MRANTVLRGLVWGFRVFGAFPYTLDVRGESSRVEVSAKRHWGLAAWCVLFGVVVAEGFVVATVSEYVEVQDDTTTSHTIYVLQLKVTGVCCGLHYLHTVLRHKDLRRILNDLLRIGSNLEGPMNIWKNPVAFLAICLSLSALGFLTMVVCVYYLPMALEQNVLYVGWGVASVGGLASVVLFDVMMYVSLKTIALEMKRLVREVLDAPSPRDKDRSEEIPGEAILTLHQRIPDRDSDPASPALPQEGPSSLAPSVEEQLLRLDDQLIFLTEFSSFSITILFFYGTASVTSSLYFMLKAGVTAHFTLQLGSGASGDGGREARMEALRRDGARELPSGGSRRPRPLIMRAVLVSLSVMESQFIASYCIVSGFPCGPGHAGRVMSVRGAIPITSLK
ncbi:hypothetical protein C7M84_021537 [Penaeus vannamei]|uniref:Uncharacterized protein n=1 Tax=Penaeus vannamei TaxID=6689 RepID=A0A3R7NKK7_PENVA|nr:hypothetical protein C7M84_021537 [Penaeus vannamei]